MPARGMTVGKLVAALADVDPSKEVILGLNDDEANISGGVFEPLEEVSHLKDEGHVQLNAWVDLREQLAIPRAFDAEAFGENLRRYRKSRGVSQQELALGADVSKSDIAALERGDAVATVEILVDIARKLDVTPSELLEGPEG